MPSRLQPSGKTRSPAVAPRRRSRLQPFSPSVLQPFRAAAILLAAGRGSRMQGAVADKILAPLAGRSVFLHSVEAFLRSGVTSHFVVVHRDARQRKQLAACLDDSPLGPLPPSATFEWVRGGAERQDSVFNGLDALPPAVRYVFIHDCARPLVRPAMLAALSLAVVSDGAVVLAHRVTDTIKQAPVRARGLRHLRLQTLDRARLWAMETPQVFERELILDAYRRLRLTKLRATDDAAAAEFAGHRVSLLENKFPNPKLTTPADLAYFEFLLGSLFPTQR